MPLRLLLIFLFISLNSVSQDTIVIENHYEVFNHSLADGLTIYESDDNIDFETFLERKERLPKKTLKGAVANLDFTDKTYFIHFTIINTTWNTYPLILETGRPITNDVQLYYIPQKLESLSGDGIPFKNKKVSTNISALPLVSQRQSTNSWVLKLRSDGESLVVPFTLWKKKDFEKAEQSRQFSFGIFYGIFIFVVIIYMTFYILLRDRLFLLYSIYVFMSGLLQFALDGYVHQYILTSGTYWTQHSVIVISGITVLFALSYASGYLDLKGRHRLISNILLGLVSLTILASLVPGPLYVLCYILINAFSLLSLVFLLVIGVQIRRANKKISPWFLIGLFSLLTGAIIFILGNFSIIDFPALTQRSLKAGTLIEILCLSILMAGKYKNLQEEKEEAQKQLVKELQDKNELVSSINTRLEEEVKKGIKEIEAKRKELKRKNDDFIASVTYAQRIQTALLPHDQKFKDLLPDSFVCYRPKDIVSGDFYWVEHIEPNEHRKNDIVVYATADCTGHGVPGAFVSIVCNSLLKIGKTHKDVQTPGQALDFVDREINATLNSKYSNEQIRDGMDVALCAIDSKANKLTFAGAKNGLYLIRNGELIEYKGDRKAIGNTITSSEHSFTTHEIDLHSGDMLYTFTDGFVDQFGGPNQKKYMSKRLKAFLLSIAARPTAEQKVLIEQEYDNWKGTEEQIDDMLLIGVRIQ